MFTGIVAAVGCINQVDTAPGGVHLRIGTGGLEMSDVIVGDSIAVNGVCLTVVNINGNQYTVTAIKETLERTSMKHWKVGQLVNLERCMPANGRFDGHVVQGHVDTIAICKSIVDENGSWKYWFTYSTEDMTVEKGSITVNGTSLTVVDSLIKEFSVAIIPYTYQNTVFNTLKVGDEVNIEFDIIGKYVARLLNH